jgi:hypothetical protein
MNKEFIEFCLKRNEEDLENEKCTQEQFDKMKKELLYSLEFLNTSAEFEKKANDES